MMASRQSAAVAAPERPLKIAEADGATEDAVEITEGQNREDSRPETSKRRMPDNLRKFLLRMQGNKLYLPAAYRIVWFRDEFPDWGIETQLIEGGQEAGFATVQARVYNADGRLISSGMKTETRSDFPAGWVEKAESGAISRALAVAGFGTQFMPELDDDGHRPADSPLPDAATRGRGESVRGAGPEAPDAGNGFAASDGRSLSPSAVWEGPGQCPQCHAPEGKRHGKPCVG
jgi:hypothetical protein